MDRRHPLSLNRRDLLKLGGGVLLGSAAAFRSRPAYAQHGEWPILDNANYSCALQGYTEVFPTSPFILNPFTDPLPVPAPMKPSDPSTWETTPFRPFPGRDIHDIDNTSQFALGGGGYIPGFRGGHQVWPSDLGLPEPIYYRLKLKVGQHKFTTSLVQPIGKDGLPVIPPGSTHSRPRSLPGSTIYGFAQPDASGQNWTAAFPGAMIYARYGRPVLIRFENELDLNPNNYDRNDFGDPEGAYLTHLHNGHTACESDGNPNFRPTNYHPGEWNDNLYLNWAPWDDGRIDQRAGNLTGGNPAEKQSFLWFHDHRMHHTGANVYKGMVGLYPVYDPVLDPGDERITTGLRLPGVPNAETGRVDYDIPLAFFDCVFDDGVTAHKDFHNGCGETHPEWWGQTFFRHYPNHGFVGDVFTVNCVAYPVLEVKRRKYRFRLLGASIARCYDFSFMSSTCGPVAAPGKQGQYSLPDGQQCLQFTQVAAEGGLLSAPIVRNHVEIWPAKRREIIVDFTKYMDGTPTTKGDVIYLVNTLQMTNGRKPNDGTNREDDGLGGFVIVPDPEFDPNYCVPMMKIVIGDPPPTPDVSIVPKTLRPLAPIDPRVLAEAPRREFELQRSGAMGGEDEWLINGLGFVPGENLATVTRGVPEVWTIRNGGGGWVHPMHLHQEEHRVLSRNGVPTPADQRHVDDVGREDVIALDPGETVEIFRNFRTFRGPYVAHCHNLAHEDHNMMFGWDIVDPV